MAVVGLIGDCATIAVASPRLRTIDVVGVAGHEFVGRQREIARLDAVVDEVARERGRLVVVTGEAGIGKTALLEVAARRAEDRGLAVAVGRCAATETPPYWPWPQLLRALDGDEHGGAVVAGGRPGLFAATAERLERATRHRPAFVVVDDLQWADESSLALSSFLVSAIAGLPVVLAFAVRVESIEGPPRVRAMLESLPADVVRLPLAGLDDADTSALLHSVLAHDLPRLLVTEVHARTAGNPLFVKEVAQLLAAQGEGAATVVPDGVRKVLTKRVARLSPEAFNVVAAASVTDDFDVELLTALTDMSAPDIEARLDEALDARLVVRGEEGCRFTHALMRQTILDVQPTTRKTEAHRRAAVALETRVARMAPGIRVAIAGRAAAHWAQVHGEGRSRAATLAVVAARDAAAALGYDQAARLYRWARELGDDGIETLTELGESEVLAGHLVDGRRTLLAAAERAASERRGDALARAVLAAGVGTGGFEVDVRDDRQVVLLYDALSLLDDDSALRAAALARLALVDSGLPQERRVACADEASAMAVRLGDPAAEVSALAARCDVLSGPDHVKYRLATSDRMVAVAERQGDPFMVLLARRHRLLALLERGEIRRVDDEIAAYARTSERVSVPLYSWIVPLWRGMRALLDGDLARSAECCETADELGRSADSHNADALVATLRFAIARAAGSTAALDDVIRRLVSQYESYPAVDGLHSVHLLLTGRNDEARRVLRRRLHAGLDSIPRDSEWVETLWNLGEVAAAVGERDAAEQIYDALVPYADLWAVDGVAAACYGVVSHQLGRLALCLGRGDEAHSWLAAARAAHEQAGTDLLVNATVALLDMPDGGVRAHPAAVPSAANGELVRAGAVWQVQWQGTSTTIRHSKGVLDIARLLPHPGTEVHVLDLADPTRAAPIDRGAGPMIDDSARRAYQQRLRDLDEDIDDASAAADEGRLALLERERDLLVAELSRAYGIGGRARTVGDPTERARKAVGMRIATAIRAVAAVHPQLARHLERSLVTGRYCSYRPESPTTWTVRCDTAAPAQPQPVRPKR
jgi:tetratricopeptide (TPR) repeat protein